MLPFKIRYMNSQMKLLALYSMPFILVGMLYIFEIRLLTEVTGNTGISIWITATLCLYYVIVIFLNNSLNKLPKVILIISCFAIVFLPVRQNISVVDYVQKDSEIYWIERSYPTGVLKVFFAEKGIFMKADKLYQDDEITHKAYLVLDPDGSTTLVYSRKPSDEKYYRHEL